MSLQNIKPRGRVIKLKQTVFQTNDFHQFTLKQIHGVFKLRVQGCLFKTDLS